MTKVFDMIAGIGMLIGIYLFLSNGRETVSIIEAMGKTQLRALKHYKDDRRDSHGLQARQFKPSRVPCIGQTCI